VQHDWMTTPRVIVLTLGAIASTSCIADAVAVPGPSPQTRTAAAAARAGDCATAKTIAAQLRARDGGTIREVAFVNDTAIQRCFYAGGRGEEWSPIAPALVIPLEVVRTLGFLLGL
jgi:hypothetical protein